MSLPASEDTRSLLKCYTLELGRASINVVAGATALAQGDPYVYGPWFGIVQAAALALGLTTMRCAEGDLVRTALVKSGDLFATIGQEIWFDPTADHFAEDEDDGHYLVGYLVDVLDADGVIGFETRRIVVAGVGT